MAEGTAKGHWVCLQNCHLAVSWLPTLDRLLEQLREADGISEDYRLWLTTMPTPSFPSTVLQSSLKLTQEPPKGLKANLGRSYIDLDVAVLEGCAQPTAYKNLLFGLCFFNAVIQERRKVCGCQRQLGTPLSRAPHTLCWLTHTAHTHRECTHSPTSCVALKTLAFV
jgi:dynein heavy chain